MRSSLLLRNRQRARLVNLRYLRRIVRSFLELELDGKPYLLGVHLVDDASITQVNESYLGHQGTTDVITFDYQSAEVPGRLEGDLLVSLPEASSQAARFHTSWQSEIVRYIVHGILHLRGYDDRTPAARRRMKGVEDRWIRRLRRSFNLRLLGANALSPHRLTKAGAWLASKKRKEKR